MLRRSFQQSSGRSAGRTSEQSDARPQSSLGAGGSRFLKKASRATNSNQSTHSSQMQQDFQPRSVISSQLGKQTAALSRLAEIERRVRSKKEALQQVKPGLKAVHAVSQPPCTHSLEVGVSSSDESTTKKNFIKNEQAAGTDMRNTAVSDDPKVPDVGFRSKSRAAVASVPLVSLETKSLRGMSGVSLESDEEDMQKMLGDSFNSTDFSLMKPETSVKKRADKTVIRPSHKDFTTPPMVVHLSPSSSTAPLHSPTSRLSSSDIAAQALYSLSALSPCPSPPSVSSSRGRPGIPPRIGSPEHSISSMSSHSEVHSLDELFPVAEVSEGSDVERCSVYSEDFKINVMTLDDLGLAEEPIIKEREADHFKDTIPLTGSSEAHQQFTGLNTNEEEEEEEEESYESDFESDIGTQSDNSAIEVSEHLGESGEEEKNISEVIEEALDSDIPHSGAENNSDTSCSCTTRTSRQSPTSKLSSRSRDFVSSIKHDSRTKRHRKPVSASSSLKDAAVQTQHGPLDHTWSGLSTLNPAGGLTCVNPVPAAIHTVGAETLEALSTYIPTVIVLNNVLRQQLAMTKHFMESNHQLYSKIVQSIGPPDYKYTTLEDTEEYIRKHRALRMTVEED
ncbi:uncharacterized protein C19orf44 homolog [Thalassophryne amazonica]|uniref:uncharacterized protein C19orf44 homolog n=1 Tax=Thalassophryne amazonica TaxID=390379 RepID=UPI0014722BFA|nr:uncharacterized protein C19orf44 homolog [Thalassophryne amazonica]